MASDFEIVKVFLRGPQHGAQRPTCACCNEMKPPSRTRTVSIEDGGSWLARIRKRLS